MPNVKPSLLSYHHDRRRPRTFTVCFRLKKKPKSAVVNDDP